MTQAFAKPSTRLVPRADYLTFGAPLIGEEEIAEVVDTLRSGWIGFGPKCLRFESAFAAYLGREPWEAVSVSSCTAALHLSLVAAGVGPGDEVITTPLTFAATVNAIEMVGARPVFVDVDMDTQNIDVDAVAAAVSTRTRAIIPVHMAGRACEMDKIREIAVRHGIVVIEDAAHAVEARHHGRPTGAASPFAAFSFYATKNLTTGEGGMILTDDAIVADRLRRLRLHGLSHDAWARYSSTGFRQYEVHEPGFKYNLTDLQASLGLHQLGRLERNLDVRTRHWQHYDDALGSFPWLTLPTVPHAPDRHARHLYTVRVTADSPVSRDDLVVALHSRNVGTGIHFRPVHLHPYFRGRYGFQPGALPIAEEIGRTTLSLPLSARLSAADIDYVVEAIEDVFRSAPTLAC
jgi:dTDP-4-amino-4,6-dideoxygalactose transaminase